MGAVDEFRDMVKALHRAGIEVILDVVYNHTAEGDETGPTHTDSMMLLTLDPTSLSAAVLSLPRDMWVEIPGIHRNWASPFSKAMP